MPAKENGEWIPGALPVPANYPNPVDNNVNFHPIGWAYGDANPLLDDEAFPPGSEDD